MEVLAHLCASEQNFDYISGGHPTEVSSRKCEYVFKHKAVSATQGRKRMSKTEGYKYSSPGDLSRRTHLCNKLP
jgi:hypothetical protein